MTTFASIVCLLLGALFIRVSAQRPPQKGDTAGSLVGLLLLFIAWGLA